VTREELAEFRQNVYKIIGQVADEAEMSTAKHGDQAHLPNGTGPGGAAVSETVQLLPTPDPHGVPADNSTVAEAAKARCKAASANEGGDGSITWEQILTEEWAEAIAESDPKALRSELVQVASVAVKWIEAIDRRAAP